MLLKELKNKSYSYFANVNFTESFNQWAEDLGRLKEKEIWDRTYINLQYFILTWLEGIIVFSETNTKNYLESPSVDAETANNIKSGNDLLKGQLERITKLYSNKILFALMVIYKVGGLSIYTHNFKGEMLDSDLIGGFLTAIRSFGAELSKKETAMKKLSYEDFEIELVDGEFTTPALITLGFPDPITIKNFNEFLVKFETKFRKDLEQFSGNVSIFRDTKDLIDEIFLKE